MHPQRQAAFAEHDQIVPELPRVKSGWRVEAAGQFGRGKAGGQVEAWLGLCRLVGPQIGDVAQIPRVAAWRADERGRSGVEAGFKRVGRSEDKHRGRAHLAAAGLQILAVNEHLALLVFLLEPNVAAAGDGAAHGLGREGIMHAFVAFQQCGRHGIADAQRA